MKLRSIALLLLAGAAIGTMATTHSRREQPAPRHASTVSTAWPMVGHDIERSNHTPVVVHHPYQLLWKGPSFSGPPVSNLGGRIFGWGHSAFLAIRRSGKVLWRFRSNEYDGGPAVVDGSGALFVEGFPSSTVDPSLARLYKLSTSNGGALSSLKPNAFSKGASPLFTVGEAYVPFVGPTQTNAKLWSVPSSGKPRTMQPGFTFDSIAMSHSGGLFAVGRYSSATEALSVERLSPHGKVDWKHFLPLTDSELSVGSDALYVVSGDEINYDPGKRTIVTAYTFNGRRRWSVKLNEGDGSLAIRPDGSIIVAGQLSVTAISIEGRVEWTRAIPETIYSPPTIALDGRATAFVGTGEGTVAVISKRGQLIRRLHVGPKRKYFPAQVAISAMGDLLVVGTDDKLRAYS